MSAATPGTPPALGWQPLPHLPLRSLIGLVAVVVVAGCAGSGGIDGVGPTGAGGSTSTPAGAATTAPAPSSTRPETITTSAPAPTSAVTTTPGTPSPTLPAGTVPCPAGADPSCADNTAVGSSYLQANVSGGTYGFRFVRVGDGLLASLNPEHGFYPASSLKVIHLLHAIRWVGGRPDPEAALATPIPVLEDPCAATGISWAEPLSAVLEAMMIRSDNLRANAIQDYFGREALNATATDFAGTTATLLAHRFGCGGPANDPANRSTALDLSRIYERIALGEALDPKGARLLASFMLGPVWPSLDAAVRAAGAALGMDAAAVGAFRDGIELRYKAGWWGTDLSLGGYLVLPAPACDEDPPRMYAFAVFVDGAASVTASFEVSDLVAVVLRDEIRASLQAVLDPEIGRLHAVDKHRRSGYRGPPPAAARHSSSRASTALAMRLRARR